MSIKDVRKNNSQDFIDDLRFVSSVMVKANKSYVYLSVTKKEVLKESENTHIRYYLTDEIFRVKRNVMVII